MPNNQDPNSIHDELAAKQILANRKDRALNTEKIVNKLDELKPTETARTAQDAMSSFVQMLKGDKGEPGSIPIKGKDYFTKDEINQIIAEVHSKIKVPEDGKDGRSIMHYGKKQPKNPMKGDLWYQD